MHRFLLPAIALLPALAGCSGKSLSQDGGVVLVYAFAPDSSTSPATVATAVRQRLGQLVPRGQLQVKELGADQIEVTLIGLSGEEVETAKKALRATGELEFRIVALRGKDDKVIEAAEKDQPGMDDTAPFARWVTFDPRRCQMPESAVTQEKDGQHRVLIIDDDLDVTAEMLTSATPSLAAEGWMIDGQFSPRGAARIHELTKRNLPQGDDMRQLAVLFDGEAISAPSIVGEISDRFRITGDFSESEVRFMTALLRTGKFPVRLKPEPVSEKNVPPAR